MSNALRVDSSFLTKYQTELNESFEVFINIIHPFIVQFEILSNEFPIELQNEIRAIYSHLAKASIATSDEEVLENVKKIKSHTKRATLDCYKYSCIVFSDYYDEFFDHYHNVDFSLIDNGEFLPKIHKMNRAARNKLIEAKKAEISLEKEDDVYELYQEAYLLYHKLYNEIEEVIKQAEHLKHKAAKKEILSVSAFIIGTIIGLAGIAVGIIGIIL